MLCTFVRHLANAGVVALHTFLSRITMAAAAHPSKRSRTLEPHIYKPKDFDARSMIAFGKPKRNQNGGKSIPIQGNSAELTHRRVIINGPKMRIAFPVDRENKDAKEGESKQLSYFGIDCSLDGHETSDVTKAFIEAMTGIDHQVKTVACNPSSGWFAKAITMDVANVLYKSTIKDGGNGWPPVIKLKINRSTQLFSADGSEISDVDVLQKGVSIVPLIEPTSIWQASNNFGISCAVVQAFVFEKPRFSECRVSLIEDTAVESAAGEELDEYGYPVSK